MVPFPDAADRLSPSGPFLPTLSAGLVRGGSGCTRESVTYPPLAPFIFQRTTDPNDLIQIPLPNFRPGNSILTVATVVFVEELDSEEDPPSLLILFPLLNVGGTVSAIDNTVSVMGGSSADTDIVRTLTQVSLWRPDPDVITEDPVIGWAGVVGGNTPLQIPGGSVATSGASSWFVAFEVGEDSITQVCPTTLIPVPSV
jgi:hypothetical protein